MDEREHESEAFSLGWRAGLDRDEVNTCPYSALDPCRKKWLTAYRAAIEFADETKEARDDR